MKHVEQRRLLFTTESRVTEMFPKTHFSHCVCSFVCWFVQLLTNKIQGLFYDLFGGHIGSAIFDFQTCQFCPLKCPKTIKTERNMQNPHIQAVKEAALKAVN